MAEVLVLADHSGDTVKKVTYELVTLARTFGEPAVMGTHCSVTWGRTT